MDEPCSVSFFAGPPAAPALVLSVAPASRERYRRRHRKQGRFGVL